MTPFRARLTLTAVLTIFLITATNALFLQDRSRVRVGGAGPSSAVSLTQFPVNQPNAVVSQPVRTNNASAAEPPPHSQPVAETSKLPPAQRIQVALQRELLRKGYASQERSLGAALLVYEYDSGLPLTGEPTEAILKHLIFDLDPAPRGPFADRAEADSKLVLVTQKALLELGFFSGTLSGHVDIWTTNAIKAFERHRGLPITGRLNEATLLEIVTYSGHPLRRVAG